MKKLISLLLCLILMLSASALAEAAPYTLDMGDFTMTLNPGDVVSTGTPGGVGMGMTPPRYLKPGDSVEFSCSAIGSVTQTVEEE